MSDLLRKANELVGMDGSVECGDGYPCPYTGVVITVIKGYQELLRHVLSLCEGQDPFYNQDIAERWDWLIGEIEKALPPEES